jgi:3,4-dihydroxy 2-butanone 4-phosphate synthase/GTP cyclohydrolase II
MSNNPHLSVVEAIEQIRAGRMVIVVDDEDRENEGDLTMAADMVTPETINFMARHGRGLICLALTEEKVAELRLPMMTSDNRSLRGTAFTVSIDARHGITTGISARERAHTIQVAVAASATVDDLVTPGHILPLRGRRGGVLVRSGHTEGAIDLARLAGRSPAGVICEIMRDDGEMARLPDLEALAGTHGLGIVRIADLIQHRLSRELLVRRVAEGKVRPRGGAGLRGEYQAYLYRTDVEDTEYLALVLGDVSELEPSKGSRPPATDPAGQSPSGSNANRPPALVRVQTASLLRDVFGMGPSGFGLAPATWLRSIEAEGRGVLVYVIPRGALSSGRGLFADEVGAPLVAPPPGLGSEAPLRDFGLGAQVLVHLGLRTIRLLTDNPRRIAGLEGYGIHVAACVPSHPPAAVLSLPPATDEEAK